MHFDVGSTWRKWDLHVHTPESHTAQYGAGEEAWDRFLDDLGALPPELSVLGINDYISVDGYQRVLEAHAAGRLPKIQAILPVVELRLNDFIGTTAHLSRLNVHILFAPWTSPALIQNQFLASLTTSFILTDKYRNLRASWSAVPTRDALVELGALIKASVPPKELVKYGSDFVEGFNNWVIPLPAVTKALDNTSFAETPLVALGKTEWESIPWNDNTIAAKKNLVSSVDLLFTAASSASAYELSMDKLRSAGVNDRLLDCSDAHHYSTSTDKDRIGNCGTWICADPTLAGLKHALWEYRARVYIGDKPPLLVHQETDPTNYISRITIRPVDPIRPPEPKFDIDLPLNSGFVAVIGNKGSGKSALLDTLALAANSHSQDDYTFLSEQRFRNPRNNKAPHFLVSIQTADGEETEPVPLSNAPDRDSPERIRYLPQSLLERLCNKEPGSADDAFEAELRSIIFSHVPEHQRLGSGSLDELLRRRGHALDQEIEQWRTKLADLNRATARLEERGRGSRRRMLERGLRAVADQLAAHDAAQPPIPIAPDQVATEQVQRASEELAEARRLMETTVAEEEVVKGGYATTRQRLDDATNLLRSLRSLRSAINERFAELVETASAIGLNAHDLVRVELDERPVQAVLDQSNEAITALNLQLLSDGDLAIRKADLTERIARLEEQLDEPRKQYEQQRRQLEAWAEARERLVGGPTLDGTLEFFKNELGLAEAVPSRLNELWVERNLISQRIHSLLLEKLTMYRELYEPVQQFLDENELAKQQFSLEFEVDLEIVNFADQFLGLIDRSAAGTFYGVEASMSRVMSRIKSSSPQSWSSVAEFIAAHYDDLHADRRASTTGGTIDSPADLLRKGVTLAELYDYLFGLSYLEAHYELRSEGRTIAELSPGQKGTILLMFYLLVDQSGRPIALDQPDENLDSHTIHKLLRPAIRAAKVKRQVLVVTHSPNLAVVGDADQVIVASSDGKEFTYRSGSIESPAIRDLVLEVLEGTWPAFADRQRKYSVTDFDRSIAELEN